MAIHYIFLAELSFISLSILLPDDLGGKSRLVTANHGNSILMLFCWGEHVSDEVLGNALQYFWERSPDNTLLGNEKI